MTDEQFSELISSLDEIRFAIGEDRTGQLQMEIDQLSEKISHLSDQADLLHETVYHLTYISNFSAVCLGLLSVLGMFYVGMTLVRGR